MAGKLVTIPLSDLCSRITKGTTPTTLGRPFVERGVNFVKSEAITDDGRIDKSKFAFIDVETHKALERSILQEGDVLFSMAGVYLGKTAVVRRDILPANTNQAVGIIRPDQTKAVPRFIHYVLSTPDCRELVHRSVAQSAQPNFNLRDIGGLPVPALPLPEQHAIAHILGTLDDKIELNRRMNETLEAMARAVFKSWFVDFDPVRAKAESRPGGIGLPKPLADLFPDRLVDSELGEIPEGWEVGTLGDVLRQRVERCEASDETASQPYVPIDCISSRSLFLAERKLGVEAQSSLTRFYKGDLLFGAMRPYFHKVCIAPFDGTTRTTAFVLVPKRPQDFGFVALLLHHPDTIDYATRHSTGSTIPYAVWTSSLEDMPTVIPPPQVREGFDASVRPMLDRIPAPYFENRTLAAMRDTLLAKLISGELRLRDTDRIIGGRS